MSVEQWMSGCVKNNPSTHNDVSTKNTTIDLCMKLHTAPIMDQIEDCAIIDRTASIKERPTTLNKFNRKAD